MFILIVIALQLLLFRSVSPISISYLPQAQPLPPLDRYSPGFSKRGRLVRGSFLKPATKLVGHGLDKVIAVSPSSRHSSALPKSKSNTTAWSRVKTRHRRPAPYHSFHPPPYGFEREFDFSEDDPSMSESGLSVPFAEVATELTHDIIKEVEGTNREHMAEISLGGFPSSEAAGDFFMEEEELRPERKKKKEAKKKDQQNKLKKKKKKKKKKKPAGKPFKGDGTYYMVDDSVGACGRMHQNWEYVAALNSPQFSESKRERGRRVRKEKGREGAKGKHPPHPDNHPGINTSRSPVRKQRNRSDKGLHRSQEHNQKHATNKSPNGKISNAKENQARESGHPNPSQHHDRPRGARRKKEPARPRRSQSASSNKHPSPKCTTKHCLHKRGERGLAKHRYCGREALVKGPKGKIRVRIVDQCMDCNHGDLDLSPAAFKRIADSLTDGRIPIIWHWI
ncbi:uncharacterized protein VTP21DRAFT_3646 [Calcarisporiella thermophila]|uniref:uncharacterized protein n=1 Tax=Calcarisporiella thermophila TaxID=911321 RepID=UPI0037443AE7